MYGARVAPETSAEQPAEATAPAAVYVLDLHKTEWARCFEACVSFAEGRQHDHCEYTSRGIRREPGLSYLTERYKLDHEATIQEAHGPTKPDTQVPVAKDIVGTLTGILLGSPPILSVPSDLESQATIQRLWAYGEMQASWMEARDMAGGGRAAVVVSQIKAGKPSLEVVRPSECIVLAWSAAEEWQPTEVMRQYLCSETVIDKGKVVVREVWKTIVWTETAVITYRDVPKDHPRETPLEEVGRVPHFMGMCPATWYRNTKSASAWGRHDYEQAESMLDAHDRLASDTYSGIGNNLDPTVVDCDEMAHQQKQPFPGRGRGVVIKRGPNAKVTLLETNGESLRLGLDAARDLRNNIYDSCEVPQLTPSNVAAYKSGEAVRMLWRKATIRAARLWPTLEAAIRRSLMCFVNVARSKGIGMVERGAGGAILLPGAVVQPDRPERGEQVPDGKIKPHVIGREFFIVISQGPYFAPTPAEKQQELTTLSTISGTAKILSQQTATEQAAAIVGVDPTEETRRVLEEEEADRADNLSTMEAMAAAKRGEPVGGGAPGEKKEEGEVADDEEAEEEEDEDGDEDG